jgi:hypothetical protein
LGKGGIKMTKQQKSILVLAIITVFISAAFLLPKLIGAGELEPSAPPGPTMKTLDEIPPTWSQILPADERFELVMGEAAVLDKETGLVWAADANLFGKKTWDEAIYYCADQVDLGGRKGWRLPTREELASLLDASETEPALPLGYDSYFSNVQFGGGQHGQYWSSTPRHGFEANPRAWYVDMGTSAVNNSPQDFLKYVWPVRSGN